MPEAHRLHDPNAAGAKITKVRQGSVYVNNLLLSVDGSDVSGHGPGKHSFPKTANGSKTVMAENKPINRQNDRDTCGHPRAGGSSDVKIG